MVGFQRNRTTIDHRELETHTQRTQYQPSEGIKSPSYRKHTCVEKYKYSPNVREKQHSKRNRLCNVQKLIVSRVDTAPILLSCAFVAGTTVNNPL